MARPCHCSCGSEFGHSDKQHKVSRDVTHPATCHQALEKWLSWCGLLVGNDALCLCHGFETKPQFLNARENTWQLQANQSSASQNNFGWNWNCSNVISATIWNWLYGRRWWFGLKHCHVSGHRNPSAFHHIGTKGQPKTQMRTMVWNDRIPGSSDENHAKTIWICTASSRWISNPDNAATRPLNANGEWKSLFKTLARKRTPETSSGQLRPNGLETPGESYWYLVWCMDVASSVTGL